VILGIGRHEVGKVPSPVRALDRGRLTAMAGGRVGTRGYSRVNMNSAPGPDGFSQVVVGAVV
jgi:hypothetical protein